jgi:hypothetical protein
LRPGYTERLHRRARTAQEWISGLGRVDIIRLLDARMTGGGFGREIWLREGSLLDACRASIAMPGRFASYRQSDNSLLVDGGLVNAVPVSLARAMGA